MSNKCNAIKKISKQKCTNKSKKDSNFCGIHMKKKNINNNDYNFFYNVDYFNDNLLLNRFTLKNLKFTIKYLKLEKLIKLNQKKQVLYNQLKRFYNFYNNESKIIKIQSFFRGFKTRIMYGKGFIKRNKCVNNDDFLTLMDLKDIDTDYFYSYEDTKGFIYGFDIKSFDKLLSGSLLNPYNREKIPDYVLRYVNIRVKYLKVLNISIEIEQIDLTFKQIHKNKIIQIFQKFDELGNYTNPLWFENLSFEQLKDLYYIAEDIWNYRAELDYNIKQKIRHNGIAFNISCDYIKSLPYNEINKMKIENIILNEFDKFVSEGNEHSDKVLGSLLMLTALVEVSQDASQSLDYLIQ